MISFLFDHLPSRTAFASVIDEGGILSHDPRKTGRVIAKTRRVAHQQAARIGEQRLEGVGVLPPIVPGKNAAIGHD